MKQTVTLHSFRRAFELAGRSNHFSHEGLEVLFNLIESFEEDTGEDIELDVVGLCCEWQELSITEIRAEYQEAEEMTYEEIIEWLGQNTVYGEVEPNLYLPEPCTRGVVFMAF